MRFKNFISRISILSKRQREYRTRQLRIRSILYAGPPPIAVARTVIADRVDLSIDALETEFRTTQDHVEVRAWLRLPTRQIPPGMLNVLTETQIRFDGLPVQTRQIYFLSTAYRLKTVEIADLLSISRRSVRRQLLAAIARRDGRTL